MAVDIDQAAFGDNSLPIEQVAFVLNVFQVDVSIADEAGRQRFSTVRADSIADVIFPPDKNRLRRHSILRLARLYKIEPRYFWHPDEIPGDSLQRASVTVKPITPAVKTGLKIVGGSES